MEVLIVLIIVIVLVNVISALSSKVPKGGQQTPPGRTSTKPDTYPTDYFPEPKDPFSSDYGIFEDKAHDVSHEPGEDALPGETVSKEQEGKIISEADRRQKSSKKAAPRLEKGRQSPRPRSVHLPHSSRAEAWSFERGEVVKGVIWSEVLGPPRCRKPHRR